MDESSEYSSSWTGSSDGEAPPDISHAEFVRMASDPLFPQRVILELEHRLRHLERLRSSVEVQSCPADLRDVDREMEDVERELAGVHSPEWQPYAYLSGTQSELRLDSLPAQPNAGLRCHTDVDTVQGALASLCQLHSVTVRTPANAR